VSNHVHLIASARNEKLSHIAARETMSTVGGSLKCQEFEISISKNFSV